MYAEEETNNLKTVISMLSFGALERSNNSYIKTIVELCVSKNQKEMITMWVWLGRKSRKRAEAMKKVSLSWKRNLCMCVWEKNITSFEITVIILCYIRNVSLWFKKDFKSAELLTETFFFSFILETDLIILIGKNLCFTEISTKFHWSTRLAASDVFHVFTQSIQFF